MSEQLRKIGEIRNQQGMTCWSIWLAPEIAGAVGYLPVDNQAGQSGYQPDNGSNGDLMTDAQKRYLFRLLAQRGMQGEAASRHLKERFQVQALSQITKHDASLAIEEMLQQ